MTAYELQSQIESQYWNIMYLGEKILILWIFATLLFKVCLKLRRAGPYKLNWQLEHNEMHPTWDSRYYSVVRSQTTTRLKKYIHNLVAKSPCYRFIFVTTS